MATKTTIEVPVEEQNVMTDFDSQVNEEQVAVASEVETSEAEVADIVTLDKEGVLSRLAEKVSEQHAARMPSCLFAAIDIPIPVPQTRIPSTVWPVATELQTFSAISG